MQRKLLIGFAALAVAAVVALPVAQATVPPIKRFPKIFRNGVKLGLKNEPVIAVGELTLLNSVIGGLTCQSELAGVARNETTEGTEKGLVNTTGYGTFKCLAAPSGAPCEVHNTKGEEVEGSFATAESPPEPAGTEAHPTGITSLPWTGEAIERETGRVQILTHHVKIWYVNPPPTVGSGFCQGVDFPYEDLEGRTEKEEGFELAPIWVNGTKNGLKPSHEEFLGETGQTEKGREFPITGKLKSELGGGFLKTWPTLVTGGLGGGWELLTVE
jgi:hypothetical protein